MPNGHYPLALGQMLSQASIGWSHGVWNSDQENATADVSASVLTAVDVRGLDSAGLDSRLRDLGRVQSRISGLIAEVVAEKKRRSRVGDTVDGLLEGLRMSRG